MDAPEQVEKIASLLGRILLVTQRLRLPDDLRRIGITYAQVQGLIFLTHHGRCSVGELARGLSITHPAAVRMVARLQRKGLVAKTESRADRRVSAVELTRTGRAVATAVRGERLRPIVDGLNHLTTDEREGLVTGLERLVSGILKDERVVELACLRCGSDHDGECVINRAHIALTGAGIEKP